MRFNVKKLRNPTYLMVSFIAGTVLGLYLGLNERILLGALIISVIALAFRKFIMLSIILTAFLGLSYVQIFIARTQARFLPGCFEGVVTTVPKATQNGLLAGFSSQKSIFAIETNEENITLGDHLKVCFEKENIKLAQDGYGAYILSQYQSKTIIQNPSITVSGQNSFFASLSSFSNTVARVLKRIYIGDKGVLSRGLILGGSQNFSDEFKTAMKASGTSHIVAVSGYNVSIITITIFTFLRSLFSRRLALTSSFVILILFCIITGGSSSVVRAAIMGGIYLVSKALGRKVPPVHLLSVAAFFMVLVNPFVLYDVGFQLSFAATAGLILAIDIFPIYSRPNLLQIVFLVMLQTLIAQIFTSPLLIYHFHQASLISIIPNALILPLVPMAMSAVSLAVIAALINIYLGMFVGFFGELLLRYFIFVIKYFASLPFSKVEISNFPLWAAVVSYIFILSLIVFLSKKINEKEFRQSA